MRARIALVVIWVLVVARRMVEPIYLSDRDMRIMLS